MKCREIIRQLETLAPQDCACDWDNPGLLAGRLEKEVKKVLLAIDADDRAVAEARHIGADMIISHHPLIFKPIKRVTDQDFIGRRLISMLQADISYFAMHTNFDAAPGCMADVVAERMGIADGKPLEPMGMMAASENPSEQLPYGIGKTGMLTVPMTGMAFADHLKRIFGLPFVTVYGKELWESEPIRLVAVCPGAGGSVIKAALSAGVQALVTGDISYHEGIDAVAQGMMIIDAGHYGLEYVFMDVVETYLKGQLKDTVEVVKMPVSFPAVVL